MPAEYLSNDMFNWWDKAQHTLAFVIFTLIANRSYQSKTGLILMSLILYGGAIELIQSMTGWRQGDLSDWFADALGVVLSSFYFIRYKKSNGYV